MRRASDGFRPNLSSSPRRIPKTLEGFWPNSIFTCLQPRHVKASSQEKSLICETDQTHNMPTGTFESLPKELIAHIASFTEPSAVLKLSATCRSIRAACWDPLILRNLLIASQHDYWNYDALDVDEIASSAGNDVTTWAQYGVADERAKALLKSVPDDPSWALTEITYPLQLPKTYISYLPELFVIKHPFMSGQCWETAVLCQRDANPRRIFCLAMTILASEENMINVLQNLYRARCDWFPANNNTSAFLWALCNIALWARTKIKQRLAAWPYNDAARVPFIGIPKAVQIPLQPLNDRYKLPTPFSCPPAELFGQLTSSSGAWDRWYRLHNYEAFRSKTYLADGTWCGYYIHFGMANFNNGIEAPMMGIQFEVEEASPEYGPASHERRVLHFHAKDCVDGIDSFSLNGSMTCLDRDVMLIARKDYQNFNFGWDWDCRLTPFGIVGFWGQWNLLNQDHHSLNRHGLVWLWKKAWTESS